jgi:hypothetical protein
MHNRVSSGSPGYPVPQVSPGKNRDCTQENGCGQSGLEISGDGVPFAISLTLPAVTRIRESVITNMNMQVVKWSVDIIMGITFILCGITGIFKFTFLMRAFGVTDIVLPMALMSDIHDWSGVVLWLLVAVHLFLNRAWIRSMTRKMLTRSGNAA